MEVVNQIKYIAEYYKLLGEFVCEPKHNITHTCSFDSYLLIVIQIMEMLLRTRSSSVALCFKIICFLSVTLTYLIISVFASEKSKLGTVQDELVTSSGSSRHLLGVLNISVNCTPATIHEFPSDGFTRDQRKHGWVLLHALLTCYFIIILASVCEEYFVPVIKKICNRLQLKEDIAGATVMAAGASCPELFISCTSTFLTGGDLGVGTIVGSAVFNILAVPACCGLLVNRVLDVEWWPISRDAVMYGLSVSLLIAVLQDEKVYFYEALILVLFYSLYILIMFYNNYLSSLAHRLVARFRRKSYYVEVLSETHPLLVKNGKPNGIFEILDTELTLKDCNALEQSIEIWKWPNDQTVKGKIWWVVTWPVAFILYMTIPNCKKYPKMFVFTFIMCLVWLSITSYILAWLITVIGDTLDIPDSVMGLTFLAAGSCVPEAVSSIIVTKQEHAVMGLSSTIASNTFDILLCLGIPWMIKTSIHSSENDFIQINSNGITYSAFALLLLLVFFYCSIAVNKYRLDWKVGLVCLLMYIGFLIFASLVELNVFFPVNLPTCGR